MAIEVGTAYISILPSTDKLAPAIRKEIGSIEKESSRGGAKAGGGFAAGFKKAIGPLAAIGATIGAGTLLKGTITEASDLGESINALNVTYGKHSKGIQKLGESAANALGLSNTEFNGLAVRFSGFTKTIAGKGGNVVGTLDKLTGRASDFASVMNLDVAEAAELFQSGLAGETEPLRKFGIDLSAAAVEAHAYKAGIADAGDELTEQQKVQARYSLLMKSTAATQGDFANTSDSLANVQRRLKSTFKDIQAEVGANLLPILEKMGAWVMNKGIPAAKDFGGWFKENVVPVLKDVGATIKNDVVPAVKSMVEWVRDNKDLVFALGGALVTAFVALKVYNAYIKVTTALTKAWAVVQKLLNRTMKLNPVGIVITALALLVGALILAYKKSDTFRKIVDKAWAVIKKAVSVAWNKVIKPALKAFAEFITDTLWPTIKRLWSNVIKPIFKAIGKYIGFVWGNIIKPVFKAWWYTVSKILWPLLKWFYGKVIKPIFDKVGSLIKKVWDKTIKPVFTALKDFVTDKVVPAFQKGFDKVKDIWNSLREAAKKPVKFVVNTLWNDGLRLMIGKLPGVETPPRVNLGFASGGHVRGPGSETSDSILAKLSNNEFVVRAAVAKKNLGLLTYLNEHGSLPGFAKGGRVWPVPGTSVSTYGGHDGVDLNRGSGWDDHGDPIWAAADGRISYVGTGKGYGLATFINGPYGSLVYGHMSTAYGRAGMGVQAGDLIGRVGNTGNSSAPHLHFGFPGGTYGQALAFLNGANVRGGSMEPVADTGGILALIKKVVGGIKGMGSSGWAGLMKDSAIGFGGDVRDFINKKIWGPGPIPGFGIFDNGGILEPGAFAYNASKKPEAVYNHRQFKQFAEAANGGDRRRVEMRITNWKDGRGYMTEIAEDTYNGEQAYAGTTRRMGGR